MKNEVKTQPFGTFYINGIPLGNMDYSYSIEMPKYQGGVLTIGDSVPGCLINWIPVGDFLIANRNLICDISFIDLDQLGFINGKTVFVDGKRYLCRVPRFRFEAHDGEELFDEWQAALDVVEPSYEVIHFSTYHSWGVGRHNNSGMHENELGAFVVGGSSPYEMLRREPGVSGRYLGFRPILFPQAENEPNVEGHPVWDEWKKEEKGEQEKSGEQPESFDSQQLNSEGCSSCKGKGRIAFSANVRTLMPNGLTLDIPVPTRHCPACGRLLPLYNDPC